MGTVKAVVDMAVADMADLRRISSTVNTMSFSTRITSHGNRVSMADTHISNSNSSNCPREGTRAMLALRSGP